MFTTTLRKVGVSGIVLVPFLLFAIAHPVAAQSDKGEGGQKIFETNCVTCHGPDGTGNTAIGKAVGAKDLHSDEAHKMTDEEIFKQIQKGNGNMPPFGGTLNKAQIDSLIPYIRELGKKPLGAKKKS
jgi:mono/diheme cytochrome c family protein